MGVRTGRGVCSGRPPNLKSRKTRCPGAQRLGWLRAGLRWLRGVGLRAASGLQPPPLQYSGVSLAPGRPRFHSQRARSPTPCRELLVVCSMTGQGVVHGRLELRSGAFPNFDGLPGLGFGPPTERRRPREMLAIVLSSLGEWVWGPVSGPASRIYVDISHRGGERQSLTMAGRRPHVDKGGC